MRSVIFPLTAALVLCGTLAAQKDPKPKKGQATAETAASAKTDDCGATQDYVIGAEDVLSIDVYGEPQFRVQGESVRPDGLITMPLVGEIRAMGKKPRELEAEIAKTLGEKYLRATPTVQVLIMAVNSRYYSIQGAVNKPGKWPLLLPTTIMQALVNAGGFQEFANLKKITLLRDGKPLETFNYKEAIAGKHPEKNVCLRHGDLIVVKE